MQDLSLTSEDRHRRCVTLIDNFHPVLLEKNTIVTYSSSSSSRSNSDDDWQECMMVEDRMKKINKIIQNHVVSKSNNCCLLAI